MAMNVDLFGNLIVQEEEIDLKVSKPSPFEYVKAFSTKIYPDDLEGYNAFITNAALSQRKDTVIYANELNKYHALGDREQFDFYFHALPKKNFFAKWAKKVKSEYTDAVMAYFDVSYKVAKQYEKILKTSQLDTIMEWYKKREGGKNGS